MDFGMSGSCARHPAATPIRNRQNDGGVAAQENRAIANPPPKA